MLRRVLLAVAAVVLSVAVWAQQPPDIVQLCKQCSGDAAYKWECVSEKPLPGGGTRVDLTLTSQVWQGLTWTHQLVLIRPAQMATPGTAMMLINGGKLGNDFSPMVQMIANQAGAPLVYLGDIPNQPLFGNLREDALIAYTFTKFLQTGDKTWPLLYPMTKSAVRAMDAIEEYTKQPGQTPITKFVVTGASKRGWTTWFVGEADTKPGRVVGIAPIVYDNLNMPAQMALQKSSYGEYSSQIDDYTALGLPDLLQTPAGKAFGETVDPYTYRDRATMPKLMLNGTNDPYWVVDSAKLYFEDLVGPKYLMYAPNTGHGNGDFMRIIMAEIGFYLACSGQTPFPQLNWMFEDKDDLKLGITTDLPAKRVMQWTATSLTRDFRKAVWVSKELEFAGGQYVGHLPHPTTGYAAMFGEVMYDVENKEIPYSTTIQVIKAP
ncbi:MAG: PhoPQ-activated pathogenicity-related family protein [Armatimonadota bacterium]